MRAEIRDVPDEVEAGCCIFRPDPQLSLTLEALALEAFAQLLDAEDAPSFPRLSYAESKSRFAASRGKLARPSSGDGRRGHTEGRGDRRRSGC